MNQWKAYFISASVCNAFLLYYFTEPWSRLVEIGFQTYSPTPCTVWLSLSGARLYKYVHAFAHTCAATVCLALRGSMQKPPFNQFVIDKHLFWVLFLLFIMRFLLWSEREPRRKMHTHVAKHHTTRSQPKAPRWMCRLYFSTRMSLCLCERIWDDDKEFKHSSDV